jgi:hypothetical protein
VELEKILGALRGNGVEFVLIGGAAMSIQGSACVTLDVDICYLRTPENMNRLAAALQTHHPQLRGAPSGLPFRLDADTLARGLNFTLTTDLGDIDLLGEVSGFGSYASVKAEAEPVEVFGATCPVLSIAGLIRSKRAAGRPRDLAALPELEALQELRQRLEEK